MPTDKRDKKPTEPRDKAASDEETDDEESDSSQLKPARPKIGEDADNLKQREEWFQRRTGRK